jgi:hypothetical protein
MNISSKIRITKCNLSDEGMMIQYSKNERLTVLKCNVSSACSILQEIGLIEDLKSTSPKPISLLTKKGTAEHKRVSWSEFVKSFSFTFEIAEAIVEKYGWDAKELER